MRPDIDAIRGRLAKAVSNDLMDLGDFFASAPQDMTQLLAYIEKLEKVIEARLRNLEVANLKGPTAP